MRRITVLALAIGLIAIFCLGAAIVLTTIFAPVPEPVNESVNAGITAVESELLYPAGMADAVNRVMDMQPGSGGNTTGPWTIHYIQGKNLDAQGQATSWLFGIRSENTTTIILYDLAGLRIIPMAGALPTDAIDFNRTLSPAELINQTSLAMPKGDIAQTRSGIVIELVAGTYTITWPAGYSPQAISFNATTGALIRSYD